MKQQSFWKKPSGRHGGSNARGKRKTARPIVTKKAMHLILKSDRASRDWALDKYRAEIEKLIDDLGKRYFVKIRGRQVLWNHIHLLIQGKKRQHLQSFLRMLPALITKLVTNAGKSRPVGRFWADLLFTRIVEWGRDYFGMQNYLEKNRLEASGIPRDMVDMWFREAFA